MSALLHSSEITLDPILDARPDTGTPPMVQVICEDDEDFPPKPLAIEVSWEGYEGLASPVAQVDVHGVTLLDGARVLHEHRWPQSYCFRGVDILRINLLGCSFVPQKLGLE